MPLTLSDSILTTLSYADIFDYPLGTDEIRLWLIGNKSGNAQILKVLAELTHFPVNDRSWFFLRGRSNIIPLRLRRQLTYQGKFMIARKLVRILRIIPSVQLVAITGGLAIANTDAGDDIDLLIVSSPGTLWITRFAVILVTEIFSKRRRLGEHNFGNSICLNMFIAADNLKLPSVKRDLYTAHELLQMVPLWDRDQTYNKFLSVNMWAKNYLPNAFKVKAVSGIRNQVGRSKLYLVMIQTILFMIKLFEPLARIIQIWYMKKHITREFISDSLLMFHPRDTSHYVRTQLEKRLGKLNIPLDKVFAGIIK